MAKLLCHMSGGAFSLILALARQPPTCGTLMVCHRDTLPDHPQQGSQLPAIPACTSCGFVMSWLVLEDVGHHSRMPTVFPTHTHGPAALDLLFFSYFLVTLLFTGIFADQWKLICSIIKQTWCLQQQKK